VRRGPGGAERCLAWVAGLQLAEKRSSLRPVRDEGSCFLQDGMGLPGAAQ
jgi:hypothetical protein